MIQLSEESKDKEASIPVVAVGKAAMSVFLQWWTVQ